MRLSHQNFSFPFSSCTMSVGEGRGRRGKRRGRRGRGEREEGERGEEEGKERERVNDTP